MTAVNNIKRLNAYMLNEFQISPNEYLKKPIRGFYHADYHGGGFPYPAGSIENIICTLKNDINLHPASTLDDVKAALAKILYKDILVIYSKLNITSPLTVMVVPRAKKWNHYRSDQLFFNEAVLYAVYGLNCDYGLNYDYKLCGSPLDEYGDGTHSGITRHTNTKTTHRTRSGHGGDGKLPYPGITKDTCDISPDVRGKNILLIDDLYTKTVNIRLVPQ